MLKTVLSAGDSFATRDHRSSCIRSGCANLIPRAPRAVILFTIRALFLVVLFLFCLFVLIYGVQWNAVYSPRVRSSQKSYISELSQVTCQDNVRRESDNSPTHVNQNTYHYLKGPGEVPIVLENKFEWSFKLSTDSAGGRGR